MQVTHSVAILARWMAADLYLREVDALRFELSQNHASDEVWRLAREITTAQHAQGDSHAAAPGRVRLCLLLHHPDQQGLIETSRP